MPVPLEIQADKYACKREHKEQKCRAGTLPCISTGMRERKRASIFVFITGMNSQPRMAPRHHTGVLCPRASRKFSVLMENRRERQITFTRFFGGGRNVTTALPMTFARPVHVLTSASEVWLPPLRESSMAGSAAL